MIVASTAALVFVAGNAVVSTALQAHNSGTVVLGGAAAADVVASAAVGIVVRI